MKVTLKQQKGRRSVDRIQLYPLESLTSAWQASLSRKMLQANSTASFFQLQLRVHIFTDAALDVIFDTPTPGY